MNTFKSNLNNRKVFTLRMDTDLLERVKQQAIANKRSIAKQIEYIVEQYLKNA